MRRVRADDGIPVTTQIEKAVRVWLEKREMICLNCHGQAHPSRAQRMPGSADYTKLMEAVR